MPKSIIKGNESPPPTAKDLAKKCKKKCNGPHSRYATREANGEINHHRDK
jgi:hypothetical protein